SRRRSSTATAASRAPARSAGPRTGLAPGSARSPPRWWLPRGPSRRGSDTAGPTGKKAARGRHRERHRHRGRPSAGRHRTAAAGVPMTDESTRSQVALAEATAAGAALGIDGVRRVIDERRSRLLARRAAVQAATADVAARQADFDQAGLDRGRMQELLGRELVSRQEFDDADSAFRMAGAAPEG